MNELGLMQRFADPALFESLDSGEKLIASLITTLTGMGVTFAVLIIIWVAIAIMARLLKVQVPKKESPAPAPVVAAAKAEQNTAATVAQQDAGASNELIAVIMAAIAASEGTEYVNDLVVRKINRTSGSRTAWNAAGTADCIDSRKF
ncbi:MAG: hypothetical protein CVU86_02200 [Firmicutes bacterium HGW-Firmicutes-11]|jgi:sodium pump decarboxylase gamma subunit|nr:MAG: hypothetical protein CVU86_02200 [Firmicutes bacterium HGW-Firmicutes-11]